jgi:transcriptional regulator with XRE-family HTH domain
MTGSKAMRRANHVGPILRRWRAARGQSQLDLALASHVSQRHVSFVESGRSLPSRPMILRLADALDVPFRERNTLLLAAGYAPLYEEADWAAPELAGVNAALDRMLRQQEPYPAIVMDRHWNVIRTNDAAPKLFGRFVDLDRFARPRNLLRLVFDPDGLRPHLADWEDVARSLIGRLHREAVGGLLDEGAERLLHDLLRYPGVQSGWQRPEASSSLPTVPLGFIHDGAVTRYFSMICSVAAPQTILTQEFRLECLFPADAESEARHMRMMA